MKVKTITCHSVYNHGAILQEYALLKYLESKGFDVEAINYQPPYLIDNYKMWKVVSPKWKGNFLKRIIYLILKLPSRINNLKRYKNFDEFSLKYLKITKKLYRSNDDLKNDVPEADVFICGSDQIWNTLFQNGKDLSFYLDFVPENKLKISYAASFAIDRLDEYIKPFIKENVSKLNYISVRENSAVKILKEIGVNNVTQVLDPVFLLEKDFWVHNFIDEIKEDYLLIYDFDSNKELKKVALKIAKEKGFKIYALNKNIRYADKIFWGEGPEKFLSLIANAQIVLSNSFHAVAFSLIFQKNIYVFDRKEKINTRMRDLLHDLDLDDWVINNFSDFNLTKSIDYFAVTKKLDKMKLHSKQFLIESLTNKK